MNYVYRPKGVCSEELRFEIENDIIKNMEVVDGCAGNALGIRALLLNQNINDVIERFAGIRCEKRPTSCPDQIAQALKAYQQTLD